MKVRVEASWIGEERMTPWVVLYAKSVTAEATLMESAMRATGMSTGRSESVASRVRSQASGVEVEGTKEVMRMVQADMGSPYHSMGTDCHWLVSWFQPETKVPVWLV